MARTELQKLKRLQDQVRSHSLRNSYYGSGSLKAILVYASKKITEDLEKLRRIK